MRLTLTYVYHDRIEFDAEHNGRHRPVSVHVGSNMLLFPHSTHESGLTLGTVTRDEHARWRAMEELTRFRCYRTGDAA